MTKHQSIFKEIISLFPIRNTSEQKNAFGNWVKQEFSDCNVEIKDFSKHNNIILGDIEKAKVIFTAHYDTPKSSIIPNLMMPLNFPISFGITLFVFIILAFLSLVLAKLAVLPFNLPEAIEFIVFYILYYVLYFALYLLLFKCVNNKNNYNDNTSGIATVLSIALENKNDDVAFILFDDEEKGLKGSKALANAYPNIKESTIIINYDCVGNGDNFIMVYSEKLETMKEFINLKEKFSTLKNAMFYSNKKAKYNSDQKNFDLSFAVAALLKSKKGLYYCNRIHTNKDVVVDENNITQLVKVSLEYIDSLK